MTRRALGPGPEPTADVRAAEADLSQALPGERWADLEELRDRGLFGEPEPEPGPEPQPRAVRRLGPGGLGTRSSS
ncbi:hypothetical protein [Streptomyces nitrosporeus]|uniref:hypothetical protein n=1 Tax=Streptomyces nitrosporeus TaxID=28894 RepID=UPI00167D485D|nr:hypothetical protein [Streptomyces nitrosporeus]GGZ27881.1 hypothetical protein GCM10010327_67880 [Streptomyces nitrosporeus]